MPAPDPDRQAEARADRTQAAVEIVEAIDAVTHGDDDGRLEALARKYRVRRVGRLTDWELCFSIVQAWRRKHADA